MNEHQSRFQHIKQLFKNKEHQQARKATSQMITLNPNHSTLYANRAILHAQLGDNILAARDLQHAISLCPFNYIYYFNLFSLQIKMNESAKAINNLCCALSCMYLLLAKQQKNIQFAYQSLQYCPNNIPAQLLAYNLNQLQIASNRAKSETQVQYKKLDQVGKNHSLRSNIEDLKQDQQNELIRRKLHEFNQLYKKISKKSGIKVQKVSISFIHSQQSKASTNKQSMIAILQDEEYFNSKAPKQPLDKNNPENTQDTIETFKSVQSEEINIHQIPIFEEHEEQQDQKQLQTHQAQRPRRCVIYPLNKKKLLRICLLNFTFFDNPSPSPKNAYCVVEYSQKLAITHLVGCRQGLCSWNQKFDLIDITPQPTLMKIRLYDKQFNSIRDHFIGQIQFVVDLADLLKLPIYNKESQLMGQIMVHLQVLSVSND